MLSLSLIENVLEKYSCENPNILDNYEVKASLQDIEESNVNDEVSHLVVLDLIITLPFT